MARDKAVYSWQKIKNDPNDFSDTCLSQLKEYCPKLVGPPDPVWPQTAEDFVSEIINEASWASSMLFYMQLDTKKGQVREEARNLSKALKDTEFKLRNISPDLDKLLSLLYDPHDCADLFQKCCETINIIEKDIKQIKPDIEDVPKTKRPDEKMHSIAAEMALRVLRVLSKYGIKASTYASPYHKGHQSDAVTILKILGDEIGLALSPLTWKDIISECKKTDSSL